MMASRAGGTATDGTPQNPETWVGTRTDQLDVVAGVRS